MTGVQPGDRTGPSEVGWSAFASSVPALLLGRGGALAFLVLWTVGPYIPLERFQDTLTLALVPLAVLFGFGLQRFQEIDHLIRSRTSGIGPANRGGIVQILIAYGGTATALTGLAAVLAYNLLPLENPLWNKLSPDFATALDIYREITLAVASLVLLPVVLIARYPFLTADPERLVEALKRPSMGGHWKQRRKARYRDALVLLVLVLLGAFVLAVLDRQIPVDASLVGLALVGLLYEAICALFRGITVGKWHRGVRVMGSDDDPVSRWRALARAAVLYAPLLVLGLLRLDEVLGSNATVLTVLVIALYGLGLAHPYGRGFHDLVAGTRITTRSDPLHRQPAAPSDVDAIPVESEVLRLPRPELEATPEDPFRQDKLDRQPQVEALCHWIEATVGHPVVMIDAEWGAGKSAFMTMCRAYLTSRGRQVVAYNAWRSGYTQQPLFDLVAAVANELPSSATEAMTQSAIKVSSLRSIWTEVRSGDTTVLVDLSQLPAETQRAVTEFQEHLKDVVSSVPGPLVVLIDELDRCRPTYAVETLETVRHLFTVDGVTVVAAVNREQLAKAVSGLYGSDFNSDRYLRRFADLRIPLTVPDREARAPFIDGLTAQTGLADHVISSQRCQHVLDLVALLPNAELRDIEYATHLATVVLASNHPSDVSHELWERYVLALVFLRVADLNAYSQFVRDTVSGIEAAVALNSALPRIRQGQEDDRRTVTRYELAAALVNLDPNRYWSDEPESFKNSYTMLAKSRAEDARGVAEHLYGSYPSRSPIEPRRVAALMDLAVYDRRRVTDLGPA